MYAWCTHLSLVCFFTRYPKTIAATKQIVYTRYCVCVCVCVFFSRHPNSYYGGPSLVGPTVHTKTYVFTYFY